MWARNMWKFRLITKDYICSNHIWAIHGMLIPSSGDKHEDKLKDVGPDDGLDAADRGVEDADDEQGDASTVYIESGDLPWKWVLKDVSCGQEGIKY